MRARKFLLGGFIAAFLCAISVAFSAVSVASVNAETTETYSFAPTSTATNAATVTKDGTSETIELQIDKEGNNADCGAYYTSNVNATMFETNFRISQFNSFGIMRIALLSDKNDFPYPERANGIGLSFASNENKTELTTMLRLFDMPDDTGAVQYENGEYIYEDALVYDGTYLEQNVYVRIKKATADTGEECLNVFVRIGEVFQEWDVSTSELSTAFDYADCQFVLVPDYDQANNTDASSENPIRVKVDSVSNANDITYKYASVFAANGTASVMNTLTLPVSAETTGENSGAYFKENISIYSDAYDATQTVKREFNMTFSLDSFNAYGGLYIGFMSSANDYPGSGYGFGVHLLDEGGDFSHLSSDLYAFSGSDITNYGGDKDAVNGENYVGKYFRIRVWDFNESEVAMYIFVGDSLEAVNSATDPTAAGTIAKATGFDSSDCVLVLTPTINSESGKEASYANDIRLSVEKISNVSTQYNPNFVNKADGSVALKNTLSFAVNENTTGETASVHYKKHVNISNGFDMIVSLDSFNAYGGLHIGFMSSANDYPGNGYGFGVYLLDEAGEDYEAFKSLGSDFYVFNGTETKFHSDKRVVSGEVYTNKYFRLKVTVDGNGDLIVRPFVGDTVEAVKALTDSDAQGAISKAELPAEFDYTNCMLVLTPTVDTAQAASYASDIRLTVEEMNGDNELQTKIFYTAPEYETETAMIDGASMRLKSTVENSGIRFSMTMDYELYQKIKHGATIGIVIVPQRAFGDEALTLETALIKNYVFETDGNGVVVEEATGKVTFNAVVTNVPEGNNTVLAARGYVIYGETYYTDYDAAKNCRSIRQVADVLWAGYKDGTLNYEDPEAAMIEKYITPAEQTA